MIRVTIHENGKLNFDSPCNDSIEKALMEGAAYCGRNGEGRYFMRIYRGTAQGRPLREYVLTVAPSGMLSID